MFLFKRFYQNLNCFDLILKFNFLKFFEIPFLNVLKIFFEFDNNLGISNFFIETLSYIFWMLEMVFFQKPYLKKCFIFTTINKYEILDLKKKNKLADLNKNYNFIKKNFIFNLNIKKKNFFLYLDFLLLVSLKYWYKLEFNIKFNKSSKMFSILLHAKEFFFFLPEIFFEMSSEFLFNFCLKFKNKYFYELDWIIGFNN